MQEVIKKLNDLLAKLDNIVEWDRGTLVDTKNKVKLYINKFFGGNQAYLDLVTAIDQAPNMKSDFNRSVNELKSIVATLIEDASLTDGIETEQEFRDKLLKQFNQQIEAEKEKLHKEAISTKLLQEQLLKERADLMHQQAKFNEFKSKLELTDKTIDFQIQSERNKVNSRWWAFSGAILLIILLIVLYRSMGSDLSFTEIVNQINNKIDKRLTDQSIIKTTIFITFGKYLFTKLFFYSIFLYIIILCVKNYNAQMHNMIINIHKSNAFRSTLSLLDTTKSAEGNDKLLLQATEAIFSHQQTGYTGKDHEGKSPNVMTNVIEAASKKVGS
jgi:hypothetical protein